MCIAYISIGLPDWPLLIAANRDEFHARATSPLAIWKEQTNIIAGKDNQAGGTWLGWALGNRYAFLTNYREPNYKTTASTPSRGALVSDYLTSDLTAAEYSKHILNNIGNWAGFNLVIGDLNENWYLTNRNYDDELNIQSHKQYLIGNQVERVAIRLKPGAYVISNHLLNTPWPKSVRLRNRLEAIDAAQWVKTPELIFDCLYDTQKASIDKMPNTGLNHDFELLLSSPFIISNDYGTRASSILAINAQGNGLFSELSFNNMGDITERNDWPI